jgi:hypothetical protein
MDASGQMNSPEDQPPGFLSRLFGGGDPNRGGLLGYSETLPLARNALLQAGLSMLQASGPSPVRPALGQVLAAGLQGGQNAYQKGFESRVTNLQASADMQRQQRQREVLAKYAGRGDLQSLQAMLSELLALGEFKGADALSGYLANAVNAQGRAPGRPLEVQSGAETLMLDPTDPTRVLARFPGAQSRGGLDTITAYQQMVDERAQRAYRTSTEGRIYDDYREASNHDRVAAENWQTLEATIGPAKQGDAAAQMSMIFSFMKMLDPGSTVREGEYATAENARGAAESVRNQYNKILKGAFLTSEQVNRFAGMARAQADIWRGRSKNKVREFRARAKRQEVNPDNVTIDWFESAAPDSTYNPLLDPKYDVRQRR